MYDDAPETMTADELYWEAAHAHFTAEDEAEQIAAESAYQMALSNPYTRELMAACREVLRLVSPSSDAATVLRMALRPVA